MEVSKNKQGVRELLERGVEMVYPSRAAFEKLLLSGKRLRVYCGFDPTAPHLHIGHAMQLRKLRQFQDLGHEVIMLIGSFTGMIGDPSGKETARIPLTASQVKKNAATYKKQASKVIRFSGINPAKIKYNHEWLGRLRGEQWLKLAAYFTVGQMIARDMFRHRLKEDKEIYLHEFLYPLMQAYDSVAMDVDAEVGGSDQMFNMLSGRTLMKKMKGKEKYVVTLKLLANDEGKKMSKSEGGFIALDDAPADMYGKIMAMDDSLIVPYFELATDVPMEEVENKRRALQIGENPRAVKAALAHSMVRMFHSASAARRAAEDFDRQFRKKELPKSMPVLRVGGNGCDVIACLVQSGLAASNSAARRLVRQGGVKMDGVTVKDETAAVHKGSVIQKGKRFFVRLV